MPWFDVKATLEEKIADDSVFIEVMLNIKDWLSVLFNTIGELIWNIQYTNISMLLKISLFINIKVQTVDLREMWKNIGW